MQEGVEGLIQRQQHHDSALPVARIRLSDTDKMAKYLVQRVRLMDGASLFEYKLLSRRVPAQVIHDPT